MSKNLSLFSITFLTLTLVGILHWKPASAYEPENHALAVQKLQAKLEKQPNDPTLLWNLARYHYLLGNEVDSKKESLKGYLTCQEYAKKAIAVKEQSVEAHYFLGICYGKEGKVGGIWNGLGVPKKIRKEMTRVLELDPAYSNAGAYRALGRMSYKLPGLLGGSVKEARDYLQEAVRLAPNFSTNRLFLAEVYLHKKEYDLACKELVALQNLPYHPSREEEVMKEREKAKKLMKKVPGKIRKKYEAAHAKPHHVAKGMGQ